MSSGKDYNRYVKWVRCIVAIVICLTVITVVVLSAKSRINGNKNSEPTTEYSENSVIPEEECLIRMLYHMTDRGELYRAGAIR